MTQIDWPAAALLLAGAAGFSAVGLCAAAHAQDSAVQQFGGPVHFAQRTGPDIYAAACQGCHMPEGKGAIGAGRYPPLANNQNLEAAGYPVYIVVNGQRAMPPFGTYLDDQQVAEVVNYIRSTWGNAYQDKVSPEDVAAVR